MDNVVNICPQFIIALDLKISRLWRDPNSLTWTSTCILDANKHFIDQSSAKNQSQVQLQAFQSSPLLVTLLLLAISSMKKMKTKQRKMSKLVKERLMLTTSLAIQSATAGEATRFSRLKDSCNKQGSQDSFSGFSTTWPSTSSTSRLLEDATDSSTSKLSEDATTLFTSTSLKCCCSILTAVRVSSWHRCISLCGTLYFHQGFKYFFLLLFCIQHDKLWWVDRSEFYVSNQCTEEHNFTACMVNDHWSYCIVYVYTLLFTFCCLFLSFHSIFTAHHEYLFPASYFWQSAPSSSRQEWTVLPPCMTQWFRIQSGDVLTIDRAKQVM